MLFCEDYGIYDRIIPFDFLNAILPMSTIDNLEDILDVYVTEDKKTIRSCELGHLIKHKGKRYNGGEMGHIYFGQYQDMNP